MNDIAQYDNNIDYINSGDIIEDAKLIIDSSQRSAHQAVNVALIMRNWFLGRRIAEEELGTDTRPELYGRKVVPMLAKELTAAYGKGFTRTSLYQYVQFYRMFPEIVQMPSGQSVLRLSWSHYVELLRVQSAEARTWYEQEAASQGWSVQTLSRNISSQYCERMLSNQVEPPHTESIVPGTAAERAERLAFIKSPMIVEFVPKPTKILHVILCFMATSSCSPVSTSCICPTKTSCVRKSKNKSACSKRNMAKMRSRILSIEQFRCSHLRSRHCKGEIVAP